MAKTDKIVKISINKSIKRKKEVISMINKMASCGEKISFYSVQKVTGASKSYLYGNKEIKSLIELYRNEKVKPRSIKSNKVIIEAQEKRIRELENELETLKQKYPDNIANRCKSLENENKELRKQLKNYNYFN